MTATPAAATVLHSLFAYKAWADDELFAELAKADAGAHPAALHKAMRILNHVHVVDSIFKAHLLGVAHAHAATNTQDTPSLAALAASVKALDAWYLSYTATLPQAALAEPVRFTFTDGDAGRMTREEILMHVIAHGGYHRGAAGEAMRSAALVPPRDTYTRFLHALQPERRVR